ncbi:MAG: ribosome assembly cofactor RimP [Bacteroidales bacterium]|nr:ribosome assembly cofactor RimP [Bacteroidales bacterium]MDD4602984.1 ribosome assembly cofactor RimP [Bacteroidales bacterium]
MVKEKEVRILAEEFLKGSDVFLLEVLVKPSNKITIFIDGENRVSIDACQKLSRFIEEHLDREKEDFELTVSSAGADRPLKITRQYKKVIGKTLEIVTCGGEKITGTLLTADENGIELEVGKGNQRFPFQEIKSAKEVITFKK